MRKIFRKYFVNLFFRLFYLFGTPPWDSGIAPPELTEFIESHPPGRAIDLGCGTGTNVLALAEYNWQASGIDFVPKAIRTAHRKARSANLPINFEVGDVTDPTLFNGTYDLILDIGCYHMLNAEQREAYRNNIKARLAPGGTFMLYAFLIADADVATTFNEKDIQNFQQQLILSRREDGENGAGRPSVWLWFRQS